MPNIAVMLKVDEAMGPALRAAAAKLDGNVGEVVLDLSAVRRIDPASLLAMAEFLEHAQEHGVRVCARGINVDIYKVLKLVKLAPRFASVNWDAAPKQES
jgi:anti-anti-sigma regulatory factor